MGSPSSKFFRNLSIHGPLGAEAYDELEMNVTAADLDPYTSRPQGYSMILPTRPLAKDTPDFPRPRTEKEIPVETVLARVR